MKRALACAAMLLLAACGSGGLPPPVWKSDAADLVARYQQHALAGENLLAERYFRQAVAATGSAGRIADTAHLWLVRCAIRRAMLIDDACAEYTELAPLEPVPADAAYYRFLTLDWQQLDPDSLPPQHRDLVAAPPAARPAAVAAIADPLARLLAASLIAQRGEADTTTFELAAETASARGWRQPLLTYLKLEEKQAVARGDATAAQALARRIRLVEESLSTPHK